MLEELIQLDREVFLYLNNLGTETWDGFWLFITKTWSAFPLYLLLLVLSYRRLGLKKTLFLLVAVALLITVTDQLSNFFKYGLQRLRPCYDPEISELTRLVKASCGGKYSYFSAHAANSFAVAGFFARLLKSKWGSFGAFLLLWASFVGYSRIYLGVHFPLDVISGAAIGLIMSWLFYRLYIFAMHKYQV